MFFVNLIALKSIEVDTKGIRLFVLIKTIDM